MTKFDAALHQSHSAPQFLPDGQHFLFFVRGTPETQGIHVGRLDGGGSRRLLDASAAAVYEGGRQLLFIRDDQLWAQQFDLKQLALTGEPVLVAGDVPVGTVLSTSSGTIAYRTPAVDSGQRQLVWLDRTGIQRERAVYPDSGMGLGPSVSRDGSQVGVFRFQDGNMDIWVYGRERQTWERVTQDPGDDIFPLWSKDDSRLIFGSRRGQMDLYSKLLSDPLGRGEHLLLRTAEPKFPMDWSHDDRFVLYTSIAATTGWDIWVLPMDGDRTPQEVLKTNFNERHPQFSPDGKWIAYESDRNSGRFEVYVRPFPFSGVEQNVSTQGGSQVRWHPNGTEIFYVAPDDWLMSVRFQRDSSGALKPGNPVRLFLTNVGSTAPNTHRHQYAVSDEGFFVMNSIVGEATTAPIMVILNTTGAAGR